MSENIMPLLHRAWAETPTAERGAFTLLQIGANDGEQDDPVAPFIIETQCRAYLVEPVPWLFRELSNRHWPHLNVTCLPWAVSGRNALGEDVYQRKMYCVEPNDDLPLWAKGCSTFEPWKNAMSGLGGYELGQMLPIEFQRKLYDRTKQVQVVTKTLERLLADEGIERIDVLVIDAEGHDWTILRQLDLARFHPRVVMAEMHTHSRVDREAAVKFLTDAGYCIHANAWDLIATRFEDAESIRSQESA